MSYDPGLTLDPCTALYVAPGVIALLYTVRTVDLLPLSERAQRGDILAERAVRVAVARLQGVTDGAGPFRCLACNQSLGDTTGTSVIGVWGSRISEGFVGAICDDCGPDLSSLHGAAAQAFERDRPDLHLTVPSPDE